MEDDDNDDIFAVVNNFCKNNMLEKKLEEVNVKNDSVNNDIINVDDLYFEEKFPSKSSKFPSKKVRKNCTEQTPNSSSASQTLPARTSSRRLRSAEIAARATVVDYVDLVSSPLVLPKMTVNVDADEESQNKKRKPLVNSVDELQNTSLRVKVKWGKDVKVFPYRKYQKFSDIIEHFAKLENVNKNCICLNLNDRVILEDDTPDSINYELHMFIYGRTVQNRLTTRCRKSTKDPNLIEIKIQCEGRKRPILMTLKKSNSFAVLYEKCAEEFKLPISKISLKFDGDILQMNDKPEDLDFEGDEIIDCKIKL